MNPCLSVIRALLLASALVAPMTRAAMPTSELPARGPVAAQATQGRVDSIDAARGLVVIHRVEYLFDTSALKVRGTPGGMPRAGADVRFKVIPDGTRQRITEMESIR